MRVIVPITDQRDLSELCHIRCASMRRADAKATLTTLTTQRRSESPSRSIDVSTIVQRARVVHTALPNALIGEGDGQNRRLRSFSFRFLNNRAKNASCVP